MEDSADSAGAKVEQRLVGSEERKAERVRDLLAGEPVDATSLGYGLEGVHVAFVAKGADAHELGGALARRFRRRLLGVRCDELTTWAWLGGARESPAQLLPKLLAAAREFGEGALEVGFGEPGAGLPGWRLSHRQARAASSVLEASGSGVARYGDIALLASMQQDDLLSHSLGRMYLAPLADAEALTETLKAYFAASRSVSSAAALLGVKRHTVTKRLRRVEEKLERPLAECILELEVCLRFATSCSKGGG